jgi:UDP-N-acetylmuramate: L-alanyl-gamma-D-glutamyl-meso-diaminopimelate ligase
MSTQLETLGIRILSPYAEANVPADADLVVIGNALSRGNPEVEAVLDRRQCFTSLPALLAEEFLRRRRSLVVAGTHGKTTTTALLAFVLSEAGLDPSFLIGGVPVDFGRSYRLGRGPHFVIEGDEYDCAFFDKRPKFVHYLPDVAVIGNVEFDHADIYGDLAAVQTAFVRLLNVIPRRGLLVAGTESPALREILTKVHCRVESFGLQDGADWRALDVRSTPEGSCFRLVRQGRELGEFALGLRGDHNVRNALAALAVAAEAGVPPENARAALGAFRGVRRRLELRGRAAGVTVYDDFAHHPTAVRATLQALGSTGRLIAVFEPRSYTSRTRLFQEAFVRAFEGADRVIVAAAHLPGKVPEGQRLSEADLVASIRRQGGDAVFIPAVDEIVRTLAAELRPGDRVAILSNGGFGGIHDKLLRALEVTEAGSFPSNGLRDSPFTQGGAGRPAAGEGSAGDRGPSVV